MDGCREKAQGGPLGAHNARHRGDSAVPVPDGALLTKKSNPIGRGTRNLSFNVPEKWGKELGRFAFEHNFKGTGDLIREMLTNPQDSRFTTLIDTLKKALHDHDLRKQVGAGLMSLLVLCGAWAGWCSQAVSTLAGVPVKKQDVRRVTRIARVRRVEQRLELVEV